MYFRVFLYFTATCMYMGYAIKGWLITMIYVTSR